MPDQTIVCELTPEAFAALPASTWVRWTRTIVQEGPAHRIADGLRRSWLTGAGHEREMHRGEVGKCVAEKLEEVTAPDPPPVNYEARYREVLEIIAQGSYAGDVPMLAKAALGSQR